MGLGSPCLHPLVPLPPRLDTLRLPERLQQMIRELLTHETLICEWDYGSVELHFQGDQLKVKLHLNP